MKLISLVAFCFIYIFSLLSHAENIRDYYEEPGINPLKSVAEHGFEEDVDPFSGTLNLGITGVFVPGNGGFDINVRHSYSTPRLTQERSPYGFGWTLHFGRIVVKTTDAPKMCSQSAWAGSVIDNPSLELPDGSRHLLVLANYHSPELITKNWWSATCSGGIMTVRSPEGTRYQMNYISTIGDTRYIYATAITDTNGNSISVNYNTNFAGVTHITSVSASDGRVISFSYVDTSNENMRLSSVHIGDQTWQYRYTFPSGIMQPPPQLSRIVRPDGTEWNFTYIPASLSSYPGELAISKISTPMGGEINYTYDYVTFVTGTWNTPTTVVASRTTGGSNVQPGVWNYSYSPGYISGSGYDETLISAPDGIKKYYHYGYSSSGSGNIWRIGLKAAEERYSTSSSLIEQITYTYARLAISTENFWHGRDPSRFDNDTYLPVLTEQFHYRELRGTTTTYSNFNNYGQPQTKTETTTSSTIPDRVTRYTYSNNATAWIIGLVTQEIISQSTGAPTAAWNSTWSYDSAGNMLSENKYGVLTTYTYTTAGDIASITDANGNITTFSNYYRGVAQNENRPEGVNISRVIGVSGNLMSETNGEGHTTSYTWDGLHRLTGITYPINANVSISYLSDRQVLTRGNYEETLIWDGFGRSLSSTRKDLTTLNEIKVNKNRDSLGRVIFESYPNSTGGISTQYDSYNRILKKLYSDSNEVSYSYPNASIMEVTDENGYVTINRYNHTGAMNEGELLQITSPESINTLIARNGIGQIWRVFQGELLPNGSTLGLARFYSHNANGFLIEENNPEIGITHYTHDAIGNMLSKSVAGSGISEVLTYDGLNRVSGISYSDVTPDVSFEYDYLGNVIKINNSDAEKTFQFDWNGNLVTENILIDGKNYNFSYHIDNLDAVSATTYPSGRVINYHPDAFGRITKAVPYVDGISYFANNIVSGYSLNNGVTLSHALDSRQRLSGILANSTSGALVNLTYNYDNAFNILSIVDGVGSTQNRTLEYDGVNRIINATGLWGSESTFYDHMGNIDLRIRNGVFQEYYYNNMRLTHRVFPSYFLVLSHDANGNVTSDGINNFSFNANRRMVSANTGTSVIGYKYDGQGMRVKRTTASETTHYFYANNGALLGEYNPDGGFNEYIYIDSNPVVRIKDDTTVVGLP